MAAPEQVDAGAPVDRPKSPVNRAVRAGLLLSLVAGAAHVFACWYSVAPHGSDFLYKHISWFIMTYFVLLVLYNVFFLLYYAGRKLLGYDKNDPRSLLATAVFLGILFVITFLAIGVGEAFRDAGLRGIVRRGGQLVTAIEQFQVKSGALPGGLEELVPDYLPAIPDTGVGAYHEYTYLRKPDPVKYDGNPWVLFVNVSTDDLMQDLMIYYPDQNYPTNPIGRNVRRFADWAIIGTPNSSTANK